MCFSCSDSFKPIKTCRDRRTNANIVFITGPMNNLMTDTKTGQNQTNDLPNIQHNEQNSARSLSTTIP